MKIEITGEPKEIAALVLEVQERQCKSRTEIFDVDTVINHLGKSLESVVKANCDTRLTNA